MGTSTVKAGHPEHAARRGTHRGNGWGVPIAMFVLLSSMSLEAAVQVKTPEALYSEGVDLLGRDDWAGAISRFQAVLEFEPDHIPSWFQLAGARAESGDRAGAIEAYRTVVGLDGTLFEARMNLAIVLQEEGRTAEAVAETEEATLLRPDDPVVALFRAELLDQLDQVEDAERGYRRVIELDPATVIGHRRLGALLRRTGRTDEAYAAFSAAAERGSMDPLVFVALGDIAVDGGNLAAGRDHYIRALELDGNDDEIRLRLALTLNELGSYGDAILHLQELEGVEPILAETYVRDGNFAEAATLYQTLTVAEPADVGHWLGLARSYYELQRLDEAVLPLERVVELDPDREQAWGMLGAIYHQRGDFESAVTVFLRLLELNPANALAHFMIATAYDNLENAELALLHYNEFLELDDGSNDARTFQVQQRAELLEKVLD